MIEVFLLLQNCFCHCHISKRNTWSGLWPSKFSTYPIQNIHKHCISDVTWEGSNSVKFCHIKLCLSVTVLIILNFQQVVVAYPWNFHGQLWIQQLGLQRQHQCKCKSSLLIFYNTLDSKMININKLFFSIQRVTNMVYCDTDRRFGRSLTEHIALQSEGRHSVYVLYFNQQCHDLLDWWWWLMMMIDDLLEL